MNNHVRLQTLFSNHLLLFVRAELDALARLLLRSNDTYSEKFYGNYSNHLRLLLLFFLCCDAV